MADQTPKNILLISFDDAVAFWKYKSAFGALLHTPNLDRICGQSTAFQAAYCQVPICSPSRASFMTGKTPFQTGILTSQGKVFDTIRPQDMWPYLLKQAGYHTSSGGKVEAKYGPQDPEIHDVLFSTPPEKYTIDWKIPPDKRIAFGGYRGGYAMAAPDNDKWFYDYRSANAGIKFLNAYDGAAPFYRGVGFYGPHGPWITPRRFKEFYDESQFKKPQAWRHGFDTAAIADQIGPENHDSAKFKFWRKSVRNYFSALTHADYHLGRLWDALKASRHARDTLVIILSDHGLHLGERNRFRKTTLWEQVLNVPLIVHDPDNPVAQVVSDPVSLLDVAPTVMDYAGLPPLQDVIGRSLRPQMHWARDPDRAVLSSLDRNTSMRKGKYRFIRYEDGQEQMYDLSRDWWQTQSLTSDHPDFAPMQAAHDACAAAYGADPARLPRLSQPAGPNPP